MKLTFEKMSGAGNDFVVIDNRNGRIVDGADLARRICDRHWGVGADGLLMLEQSPTAAYRMMYYNADGSFGGMCGNGGRCIAAYAVRAGIAPPRHEFDALDHLYGAEVKTDSVRLTMKDPTKIKVGLVLPVAGMRLEVAFIDTGSPHAVVFVRKTRKGVDGIDVQGLGSAIRTHRRFKPEGTNVNFVEIIDTNTLKIRTYERGVETETLACGTGAIASAIIASRIKGMRAPIAVFPRSQRRLIVDFEVEDESGRVSHVALEGPAETVFTGEFEIP